MWGLKLAVETKVRWVDIAEAAMAGMTWKQKSWGHVYGNGFPMLCSQGSHAVPLGLCAQEKCGLLQCAALAGWLQGGISFPVFCQLIHRKSEAIRLKSGSEGTRWHLRATLAVFEKRRRLTSQVEILGLHSPGILPTSLWAMEQTEYSINNWKC